MSLPSVIWFLQMTLQNAISVALNPSFCDSCLCHFLCKCSQVREFRATVLSNKRCPPASFLSATPESRYQTPWQQDERKSADWEGDVKPQRCIWSYITGHSQLCRCVCLSGVDSELLGLGGDSQVLYGSCQAGWYWWQPRGIGRLEVCVYELETVVPLRVMTTCAPFCLIYGSSWSLLTSGCESMTHTFSLPTCQIWAGPFSVIFFKLTG